MLQSLDESSFDSLRKKNPCFYITLASLKEALALCVSGPLGPCTCIVSISAVNFLVKLKKEGYHFYVLLELQPAIRRQTFHQSRTRQGAEVCQGCHPWRSKRPWQRKGRGKACAPNIIRAALESRRSCATPTLPRSVPKPMHTDGRRIDAWWSLPS